MAWPALAGRATRGMSPRNHRRAKGMNAEVTSKFREQTNLQMLQWLLGLPPCPQPLGVSQAQSCPQRGVPSRTETPGAEYSLSSPTV